MMLFAILLLAAEQARAQPAIKALDTGYACPEAGVPASSAPTPWTFVEDEFRGGHPRGKDLELASVLKAVAEASPARYNALKCLLAAGINQYFRNLASGRWLKGDWGSNGEVADSADRSDPDRRADYVHVSQGLRVNQRLQIADMKKALIRTPPGKRVIFPAGGKSYSREELKSLLEKRIADEQANSQALNNRIWGTCQQWSVSLLDAMAKAGHPDYYVGPLELRPSDLIRNRVVGLLHHPGHMVAQVCPRDCGTPCLTIDGWGKDGLQIMTKAKLLSGGNKWLNGWYVIGDHSPCR